MTKVNLSNLWFKSWDGDNFIEKIKKKWTDLTKITCQVQNSSYEIEITL
jgi:hypothetical protein